MPLKSVSYKEARKRAELSRPMLVLVGGVRCHACRVVKNRILEPMQDDRLLDDISVVQLDVDDKLPENVFTGNTIPQIVLCVKAGDQWYTNRLTGEEITREAIDANVASYRYLVNQSLST